MQLLATIGRTLLRQTLCLARSLQPLSQQSWRGLQCLVLGVVLALGLLATPASASVNDDRYDGNIFPLYAGNGSIVPPRVTLKQSLKRGDRPTILGFYLDDSKDCKQYSAVWSAVDSFYGRAGNIILLTVDSILPQESYQPDEPGYYYSGVVPQTVIIDESGKVVLSATGDTPFETLDDALREVFDLLPREESVELRRRSVNEQNLELVPNS